MLFAQCGGLALPVSAVAAQDNLVISTFDANRAALETMAGISLPAVFAGLATSVSVSLSSVISNEANVAMTLSFISPSPPPNSGTKFPIKLISLNGVFFHSLSATQSAKCYHQSGQADGLASLNSSSAADSHPKILVIKLSGTDSIASGSVSCVVSGFRNLPNQRKSELTLSLSTWDAQNAPVDTASVVAFPNIFEFVASNGTFGLSHQIIEKTGVSMTFKFIVPYTGQSIAFISLSGLPFSPLLPQTTPSAFCSVNDLLPSINSNSVRFILTNSLAELTTSFESPGLPVGSGPFGVGKLSVTCKVSNLVNAPVAAGVRPIVSAVVFGINDAPLYFQSGFKFPALFEQSLGFKRPRVSS